MLKILISYIRNSSKTIIMLIILEEIPLMDINKSLML